MFFIVVISVAYGSLMLLSFQELEEQVELMRAEEDAIQQAEEDAREQLAALRKAAREEREARRKQELEKKKQYAQARRDKEKQMMEEARKKEQEMLERIADSEMRRAIREEEERKRDEEERLAQERYEVNMGDDSFKSGILIIISTSCEKFPVILISMFHKSQVCLCAELCSRYNFLLLLLDLIFIAPILSQSWEFSYLTCTFKVCSFPETVFHFCEASNLLVIVFPGALKISTLLKKNKTKPKTCLDNVTHGQNKNKQKNMKTVNMLITPVTHKGDYAGALIL